VSHSEDVSKPFFDRGGGPIGPAGIAHNAQSVSGNRPPDGASQRERAEALQDTLAERVVVMDGATGTWLQGQDLSAADFGGPELEGCNENLVFTRPDVVRGCTRSTSPPAPT
jgi:hypothetical protein